MDSHASPEIRVVAVRDVGAGPDALDECAALSLLFAASGHDETAEPEQAKLVAKRCRYLRLALTPVARAVASVQHLPWTGALRMLDEAEAVLEELNLVDGQNDDPDTADSHAVYQAIHVGLCSLPHEHQPHYVALACAFQEGWHIADDLAAGFLEQGCLNAEDASDLVVAFEAKSLIQRASNDPPRLQFDKWQRAYTWARFNNQPQLFVSNDHGDHVRMWCGIPMYRDNLTLRAWRAYVRILPRRTCTIRSIAYPSGAGTVRADWTGVALPMSVGYQRMFISVIFLVKALETNCSVRQLTLESCGIGGIEELDGSDIEDSHSAESLALGQALKHNTSVEIVELSYNRLGDVGATAIAKALSSNNTVRTLSLGSNAITDAGASSIAEALQHNSGLHTLDLSNNRIGDEGCTVIAIALKCNTTIQTLDLSSNLIGARGAAALGAALRCKPRSLNQVHLSHNHIGSTGIDVITKELEASDASIQVTMDGCCATTTDTVARCCTFAEHGQEFIEQVRESW